MIARGDLAIDIGHSEVPKVQLSLIKKCSQFSKSVIVATQMLESMIENNTATRAEINDIATAIFQGADTVMLSAEAAIGKFPTQAVSTMRQTILSTEKFDRMVAWKDRKVVDVPIDEGIRTYKNVERKDSLVETALSLDIYIGDDI